MAIFVELLSIRLMRAEGCDCEPSRLEDKLITVFINVCLLFIRNCLGNAPFHGNGNFFGSGQGDEAKVPTFLIIHVFMTFIKHTQELFEFSHKKCITEFC